jgi:hypothetical protein
MLVNYVFKHGDKYYYKPFNGFFDVFHRTVACIHRGFQLMNTNNEKTMLSRVAPKKFY